MSFEVVITGATGFMGRALIQQFSEKKIPVRGVSRRTLKGFSTVNSYADIASSPNSVLIHLAQPRDAATLSEGDETSLCSKLAQGQWKHIIYASSSVVYGDSKQYPRRSDEEVSATSEYIKVKLACEEIIAEAGGTSIRFSNVYGQGMGSNTVLADILRQIPGKDELILRDTSPVRDFLWINDAASCIIAASMHMPGCIINAGSGIGISVGDLAIKTLQLAGESNRKVVSKTVAEKDSCLLIDISQTQSLLNWSPEVDLVQGLSHLLKLKMNNE